MTNIEATAGGTEKIGYKKPPKAHQFKPGQSGNPKGRPPKRRNAPLEKTLRDMIIAEGFRRIPVRDGEQVQILPLATALLRKLGIEGAKGSRGAARDFLRLIEAAEASKKADVDTVLKGTLDYKNLWAEKFAASAARGEACPAPVPHPDHLHIDAKTGEVFLQGPLTVEEKKAWDSIQQNLKFWKDVVPLTRAQFVADPNEEGLAEDLEHAEKVLQQYKDLDRRVRDAWEHTPRRMIP